MCSLDSYDSVTKPVSEAGNDEVFLTKVFAFRTVLL